MTSKEALEIVKDYLLPKLKEDNSELGSIIIVESVNVLEKLVERDTPMKVIKDDDSSVISANCPKCNRVVDKGQKGCPYCLQRLDWRKNND